MKPDRSIRGKMISKEKASPLTIAVSQAAGNFGHLLTRRLHRDHRVTAIDTRSFPIRPSDVGHVQRELRSRKVADVFRKGGIDAVVHLAIHNPKGSARFADVIENFARLLDYCDRYNVSKLVLVSSSTVYGASPRNPQFMTEGAPLLAADMTALRDMDMMTQSFFWKRPDIETVILRPAHITGDTNGPLNRYLRLSKVPVLMGYDPMMQLVHEEDVVEAVRLALRPGCRGIFNIAGPDPVPLRRIIESLHRSVVHIPHPLVRPALERLSAMGKIDLPPEYANHVRFVCMVDDSRAKESMGYRPTRGLQKTIAAVDLWR